MGRIRSNEDWTGYVTVDGGVTLGFPAEVDGENVWDDPRIPSGFVDAGGDFTYDTGEDAQPLIIVPFAPTIVVLGQPENFPEDWRYHTVVTGDTLWSLSRQWGTTVEQIMIWNPEIEDPNLIYVGQELRSLES